MTVLIEFFSFRSNGYAVPAHALYVVWQLKTRSVHLGSNIILKPARVADVMIRRMGVVAVVVGVLGVGTAPVVVVSIVRSGVVRFGG